MMRRNARAQLALDLFAQYLIQYYPIAQDDKERHVVAPTRQFDADDQAIQDFRQPLDNPIDLATAHPDAHAVNGRVRTTVDDRAALRSQLNPIAMTPDAGIHRKI